MFTRLILRFLSGLSLSGMVLLSGCLAPPEPVTPMPAIWKQADPGQRQDTLLVFLPGRYDEAQDFLDNGFWQDLQGAGIPADAVFTDAHLGYYYRQVLATRLLEDILQPARRMGYEQIWVVGISLGGLGAVLFDYDSPGWWDGLVLIAPFPGDKESILETVRSTASVAGAPLPDSFPEDDYTAKFWHWARGYLAGPERPLFLAYGEEDRLAGDLAPLARELPDESVFIIRGNHNWKTWEELWRRLLPGIRDQL